MFMIKQNIISSAIKDYIQLINKRTFANIIKQHQKKKEEASFKLFHLLFYYMYANFSFLHLCTFKTPI